MSVIGTTGPAAIVVHGMVAVPSRFGAMRRPRLSLRGANVDDGDPTVELSIRFAALRVGHWLGWASIVVVLAGLALDTSARHRWLLVALTLSAAAGNTVAMIIPWREW